MAGDMPVGGSSPFGFRSDEDEPLFVTAAGEALNVFTVTGKAFGVVIGYTEGA